MISACHSVNAIHVKRKCHRGEDREEIKKIIQRSVLYYPFPSAWRDLNRPTERRVEEEEAAVKR